MPDVVWISDERLDEAPDEVAAQPVMPELCVEVLSPSNTPREMEEKRALYLSGGALEVWLVSPEGAVTFYDESGPLEASRLAPTFPAKL